MQAADNRDSSPQGNFSRNSLLAHTNSEAEHLGKSERLGKMDGLEMRDGQFSKRTEGTLDSLAGIPLTVAGRLGDTQSEAARIPDSELEDTAADIGHFWDNHRKPAGKTAEVPFRREGDSQVLIEKGTRHTPYDDF